VSAEATSIIVSFRSALIQAQGQIAADHREIAALRAQVAKLTAKKAP